MKRVMVKSVFDTFEYVMDHYYPYDLEELAQRKDIYAIISIQDSHTNGFGIQFCQSQCCKDVLTLYFDDVVKEVEGTICFNEEMAKQIIDFVIENENVDSLVVHCYAGQSRSLAVGAFVVKMLGANNEKYFTTGSPNMFVYTTLEKVYEEMKK